MNSHRHVAFLVSARPIRGPKDPQTTSSISVEARPKDRHLLGRISEMAASLLEEKKKSAFFSPS
jgi:hypothetical protein